MGPHPELPSAFRGIQHDAQALAGHKHQGARCPFRRSRLRRNTHASTRGSPQETALTTRPTRGRKRRTRGNGPGRRRSVELHAQYLKLLIVLISVISPIVQHYMR